MPPNADQIIDSLVNNGTALMAAASITTAGIAAVGIMLCQRWLHAAVDAS